MTIEKYKILDYEDIIKELENDECMFFGELKDHSIIKLIYKDVMRGFSDSKKITYYEIMGMVGFESEKAHFKHEEIEADLRNNKKEMEVDKNDILNKLSKYLMFKHKLDI